MLALAFENLVRANMHFDIQIAWRPTIATRLTLAREANAIAVVDARRNLHRQLLGAADAALAQAGIARVLDDLARTATTRAGLLQLEEALRYTHLPRTMTGIAGDGIRALGRAAAVAGLAFRKLGHVDFHRR